MKLVKLSLVAALAAGAFSVANATPLDEAIKDVDISGALRYRYNNGDVSKETKSNLGGGIGTPRQAHQFLGKLGFQAAIADNFKAYGELYYNPGNEDGFGTRSGSNTNTTFSVRQSYLSYTDETSATSVLFGKMQVESIWTTSFLGLVGTGAKVINTSIDGTVLAAYAFDNFDAKGPTGKEGKGVEGDTVYSSGRFGEKLAYNPFAKNLYGGAIIGSYDVGFGQLDSQLWLAYLTDTFFLYAVDLGFKTTFANDLVWKLNLAYLGNNAAGEYKDIVISSSSAVVDGATHGNFVGLNGTIEYAGFDASLGGFHYGDKNQFTLTTLEDDGGIGKYLAGQEIYYTNGSNLTGDIGQNIFGFVKAGYTFNEVLRLGLDVVYGGTKVGDSVPAKDLVSGGGEKIETVARVDYKYSPKLNFQAWYSYLKLNSKNDNSNDEHKNSVRLQALYKF